MDRIVIEDLLLRCIVGVNPEERVKEQDVVLRIALDVDLRAAGRSDALGDTVDYKSLKAGIRTFVEGSRFLLVERLAHEVARLCLEHAAVEKAWIRVEKPGALRFARTVAVEVERTRADYQQGSRGEGAPGGGGA
ncbi:MAG: dihydroneopterin aldolase [Lentisphaeria bacterium]|nr:dihydroneopterin aldolase [Lentisphaeria bacterium]